MATANPKPASVADHDPDRALEMTRVFDAPRERVFRAWTDAEHLKAWMGPPGVKVLEATADARIGGAYRIAMRSPDGEMHTTTGVYREIKSPERLVFTWGWVKDGQRGHESVVTVELRALGAKTELRLRHAPLENKPSRDHHLQGWQGCCESLAAHLAAK